MSKYLKLLDKLIYTKIEDFVSFRNSLVLTSFALLYLAIRSGNEWAIGGMCGLATIILKAYFDGRNESVKLPGNGFHKSDYKAPDVPVVVKKLKTWWGKR